MDELTATDATAVEAPVLEPAVDVEPMPDDAIPEPDVDPVLDPDLSIEPVSTLHTEAKSRSLRSLSQGAVMAALTSLVIVLYPLAQTHDLSHVNWTATALVGVQAVGTAVFSYLQKALGK